MSSAVYDIGTVERGLCGALYTAEWQLDDVSYTAEYVFRGVRNTGETIAKQIKPATALKGTIFQKTDNRCTL